MPRTIRKEAISVSNLERGHSDIKHTQEEITENRANEGRLHDSELALEQCNNLERKLVLSGLNKQKYILRQSIQQRCRRLRLVNLAVV